MLSEESLKVLARNDGQVRVLSCDARACPPDALYHRLVANALLFSKAASEIELVHFEHLLK